LTIRLIDSNQEGGDPVPIIRQLDKDGGPAKLTLDTVSHWRTVNRVLFDCFKSW